MTPDRCQLGLQRGPLLADEDPDLPAATEVMQRWGTRTSQSFDKPKYPNCEKRQKEHSSARE
jgi:hypothetical protein